MKSLIKLFLVVILFSSVVFAEGEMGNGTRTCPNGQTSCLTTTQPGGDEKPTDPTLVDGSTDSILTIVQEYFDSVIKYFEN